MDLETINKGLMFAAISLEGVAALSAIVYYKKYTDSILKYLPLILSIIFLNELYSTYIHRGPNNVLFYNISAFVIFNYFYWIFLNNLHKLKIKKFIKIGIIFYFSAFVIDAVVNDIINKSLLSSYYIGGGLIIFCAIFYYMQKLENEKDLDIKGDLIFWISTGLLLFYVGYLPIKFTRIYHATSADHFDILLMVHLILLIVLNLCYTLGFRWTQKK